MKIFVVLIYVVLGAFPTIFLFANHDWMCKYDMNPLCYIECVWPALLSAPILFLNGEE